MVSVGHWHGRALRLALDLRVLLRPHQWGWLRITLLVVSPPSSGLIALRMAERRRRANDQIDSILHFWIALCFSIGFVWTRFVLTHRPG
jgi:hypothetical protein